VIRACQSENRRGSVRVRALTVLAIACAAPFTACSRPPEATRPADPAPVADGSAGPLGAPAPRLVVTLGDARLAGGGSPPDAVELRAADGVLRGTAAARVAAGGWTADIVDAHGLDAYARPGDALALAVAGVTETLAVPPLAVTFGSGGRVAGQTAPGARVVLDASEGEARAAATGAAGADGSFDLVLDPPLPLTASATVTTTVSAGPVVLVAPRRVPYVRISTHPGDVSGYAAPLGAVTLTLLAGGPEGEATGSAALTTDAAGRFDGWVRDAAGARVRPQPGDAVQVDDADGVRTVAVAPLAVTADPAAGTLDGSGTAEDAIQLTIWNPWRPGATESPTTTVAAGGRWSVTTEHGLPPATHFYVTERDARGDETFHCYQIPRLHVQPGSPIVGIEALWDVTADLALTRGGAVVGRAAGGGMWATDVELVVRDDAGQPVALAPGDRLTGTVDETTVALEVPHLTAAYQPDGGIAGEGPPGAVVGFAAESPFGITTTISADGTYRLAVSASDRGWQFETEDRGGVAPGALRQVTTSLADGHAARIRFVGPRLEAVLGEARVSGIAEPGAEVEVEHTRANGTGARSKPVRATADALGAFTATLAAAARAGDRLVVAIGGQEAIAATLPSLDAARDVGGRRITGTAPPDVVLDASVWYGEATGAERSAIVTRADGSFELELPAAGATRIELAFEEPGVRVVRVVVGGSS